MEKSYLSNETEIIDLEKADDMYHFNAISNMDLDTFSITIKQNVIEEYMPYILGHTGDSNLTYFERYICYLLRYHKKKEVRQLLGCTPSYLSKVLSKIKKKTCQTSSEEN